MKIEKLYRPANVSRQAAIAALFKARPGADLVSFRRVVAKNGTFVDDPKGPEYEATLHIAGDFPPEDSGGDDAPPAGPPADDAPTDDAPPEDDAAPADEAAPDFKDEGGEGEKKPKKLKPEEEMVSLLRQLLDAVQGGGGLGHPGGDPDLGDLGAGGPPGGPPGVGAPPPPGGGGGAPGGPPLPPPVPHKAPMPGGGAFAHVANVASFKFERVEASAMGNHALVKEASELVPTHKVSKIERNGDKALLTLEKR